jgi:4-hydroxybenzoate polyprenyltransferase
LDTRIFLFCFCNNLIREIIKDTEDFEGDSAYGRNSLPIVLGINYTKLVLMILITGTIASFAIIYLKYLTGFKFTLWYLIVFQVIPLIYLAFRIIRANTKKDYTYASGFMKIIMLGGLLYSLVAAYNFLYHA